MRLIIGIGFLGRTALVALFLLAVTSVFIALRFVLQDQMLSAAVLLRIALVQLPHVAYLGAGLAAYWSMHDLRVSGQLDLLRACGMPTSRIAAAIVVPAIVLSAWMALYDVTLFRKASLELSVERAMAEIAGAADVAGRKDVLRIGDVRASAARAKAEGDRTRLEGVVLSVRGVVLTAPEVEASPDGLAFSSGRFVSLEPLFVGNTGQGRVELAREAPLSWRYYLADDPPATARSLAFGLDIVALVTAAVVCASRGGRRAPARWFAVWCATAVLPLLLLQNWLTAWLGRELRPALFAIPAVPLALALLFALAAVLLEHRERR